MKKPNSLLPVGIIPLTILPLTVALVGCSAPADDTTVINSSSVSTTSDSSTGDGAASTAATGTSVNGSTTSTSNKATRNDSGKATPLNADGDKAPAKPAASKEKPDPAYRIVGPESPGYVPEMEKVRVPPPPANFKLPANPRVKFVTSKGSFVIQLNPKEAPLHSKSFYYLSKRGFYDGVVFHRYADLTGQGGYIIQGGDPFTRVPELRNMAGGGGPGYAVPRERNKLTHEKLVIAAARTSDPDSAGSQFYFTYSPIGFLDEGDGYTVFGKVINGGDTVLKLTQDDVIKSAIAQ